MSKKLPILLSVLACTIYGFSLFFASTALSAVDGDIYRMLSMRFGVVVMVMSGLIFFKIIKVTYQGKKIIPLVCLGLLQPIGYFFGETYGIIYSPSFQVGVMISLIPVITTSLGVILLKEKPNYKQVIAMALSMVGIIFINTAGKEVSGSFLGFLFMLLAVFCGSMNNILVKSTKDIYGIFDVIYFVNMMGFVCFSVIAIIQGMLNGNLSNFFTGMFTVNFVSSIFYLSILSSLIAFSCMNYAVTKISLVISSSNTTLVTLVSILAGVLLLGEAFGLTDFIGTVLILSGAVGVNLFSAKDGAIKNDTKELAAD